jgi:hypothetical protein
MSIRIRRAYGVPFGILSAGAFAAGLLFHHQALDAAASEAARQELGSCCHPAKKGAEGASPESARRETRSKAALGASLLFLAAAVAPAALARSEREPAG